MNVYEILKNGKSKIAVIGLGYVGLPVALAFDKSFDVVGFDIDNSKIMKYEKGIDPTGEMGNERIKKSNIFFTSDPSHIKLASFVIITVPTPINVDKTPDLSPILNATEIVAKNMSRGSYIIYESTVYPGATEEICIPLIESISSMKSGRDFYVGYSPERINPGDKINTFETIKKIVSGENKEITNEIARVYGSVIEAGIHQVNSIKAAEAAKVVENSQRDLNIAFMNELAMVFDKMSIDTKEVIDAMNTKWNSLGFTPGLVGGHCIGVDPYYFIYQAERLGYHSQLIISGRNINESIPKHIVENTINKLIENEVLVKNANVAILGLTFKENTNDTRNSKVFNIIQLLNKSGINTIIVDPYIKSEEILSKYNASFSTFQELQDIDAIIIAVPHTQFKEISLVKMSQLFRDKKKKILIDVKSIINTEDLEKHGFDYWRL